MSKVVLILASEAIRDRACRWVQSAPRLSRVELKEPARTLPQNARFWASLTDVARCERAKGRDYSTETWRTLFLHAAGREMQFVPSLDGDELLPLGHSSAELSVGEMSNVLEFIYSWGAENGVVFTEPDKDF